MTLTLIGHFISHDISQILSFQYTINTKLLNIPVFVPSLQNVMHVLHLQNTSL